jgi:hypothetical protein
MTPKEKAKELEELFTFNCRECDNSKISALIAVDEILKAVDNPDEKYLMKHIVEYWRQVKQEIEKL